MAEPVTAWEPPTQLPPMDRQPAGVPPRSRRQVVSASNWLFIVAGLTAFNSVSLVASLGYRMLVGLGTTLLALFFFWPMGSIGQAEVVAITAVAVGVFAYFGWAARKADRRVLLVALVAYGLDTLVVVSLRDWPGALFHAFGLMVIFQGWVAAGRLESPTTMSVAGSTPVPPAPTGPPVASAPPAAPAPAAWAPFDVPDVPASADVVAIPAPPAPHSAPAPVVSPLEVPARSVRAGSAVLGWAMIVLGILGAAFDLLVIVFAVQDTGGLDGPMEVVVAALILIAPLVLCGMMIVFGARKLRLVTGK